MPETIILISFTEIEKKKFKKQIKLKFKKEACIQQLQSDIW